MRGLRAALGGIVGVAVGSSVAAAEIRLTPGPLDLRLGELGVQWVTVANAGAQPLRQVYVRCTFFAGDRPLASGTRSTTGGLAPGEQETIEVTAGGAAGATRTECRAREGAS